MWMVKFLNQKCNPMPVSLNPLKKIGGFQRTVGGTKSGGPEMGR